MLDLQHRDVRKTSSKKEKGKESVKTCPVQLSERVLVRPFSALTLSLPVGIVVAAVPDSCVRSREEPEPEARLRTCLPIRLSTVCGSSTEQTFVEITGMRSDIISWF